MDLKGKTVCITGKFSELNRKEAEAELEKLGATCSGSVSKNTDILFAGEKAGSKLAKASSLGVQVLGESDLIAILSGGAPGEAAPEERPSDDLNALMKAGRVTFQNNTPHETDLTGWNISPDGKYFATGSWCGDDYEAGGSLAVWEVATGRCVNQIDHVTGGVGWPDEAGVIQWSQDSRRLGLSFDTNGVGYADPFKEGSGIQNWSYATDGQDHPPQWCWAPDGARMFVSCWGYQQSALAGAIVTPSPHGVDPVYMAKTGFEDKPEDGPQVGTMRRMVWRPDGIIVGFGHHGAYAIDSATREMVWSYKEISQIAAIDPKGNQIAFHHGGLKFLDAKTGKLAYEPKHIGGGDLAFSADGEWLLDVCHAGNADKVTPSIRVYKGPELAGVIDIECGEADYYRKENPQAAFFADNSAIAAIRNDDTLVVFENKPGFKKLFEAPAFGAKNIHVGDAIVLSSKESVAFYTLAGKLIARHELFETPNINSEEELFHSAFKPFAQGDSWGFVAPKFLITTKDPGAEISAVVDHKFAYPVQDLELSRFESVEAGVKAAPKLFPKVVADMFKGAAKAGKAKKSKEFIQPNTHGVQDLEDYLEKNLSPHRGAGKFLAELALHRIREGKVDSAEGLAKKLQPAEDLNDAVAVAHLAAAAARHGHTKLARDLASIAEAGLALPEHEPLTYALKSWLAGTAEILGDESPYKVEIPKGHMQGNWVKPAALLAAWKRDAKGVVAALNRLSSGIWWHDLAEIADAVLATRDLDYVEDFLKGILKGGHAKHFELLQRTVDLCLEVAPERALGFLPYFDGLSTSKEEERILERLNELDPKKAEAVLQKLEKERDFPETHAMILKLRVRANPAKAEELLLGFLQNLDASKLHRYNGPTVALALAEASLEAGCFESAMEPVKNLAQGHTWAEIIKVMGDNHPGMEMALEGLKSNIDLSYIGHSFRHLEGRPEIQKELLEAALEKAGRDRYNLQSVVKALADAGLLDEANTARMKITKANRKDSTRHLAAGAIRAGEYTTALGLLDELDSGYFGTGGREYTLLHALVTEVWKTVPGTSGVM